MEIKEAIKYVSQLFMNISGYVDVGWKFEGEDDVRLFNRDSEGSPADDIWEAAVLVSKLTGWEPYHITEYDGFNQYGGKPYYVGLKKPSSPLAHICGM